MICHRFFISLFLYLLLVLLLHAHVFVSTSCALCYDRSSRETKVKCIVSRADQPNGIVLSHGSSRGYESFCSLSVQRPSKEELQAKLAYSLSKPNS